MSVVMFLLQVILLVIIQEAIIQGITRNYREYVPIRKCLTFWTWVHYSWNFIGPRNPQDRTIVRHIGIRWFGFVWDREIEIPMGELRF